MGERDVAGLHFSLVHAGMGPQNYTIREIQNFLCIAHLDNEGDFEFSLESGQGSDEFYEDYPHLRDAEGEHLRRKTNSFMARPGENVLARVPGGPEGLRHKSRCVPTIGYIPEGAQESQPQRLHR